MRSDSAIDPGCDFLSGRIARGGRSMISAVLRIVGDLSGFTAVSCLQVGTTRDCILQSAAVSATDNDNLGRDEFASFVFKVCTENGIWDIEGNATPLLFVRARQEPDSLSDQALRGGHIQSLMYDLTSGRGLPMTYRRANGYVSHTYRLINGLGDSFWARFHFRSPRGARWLGDLGPVQSSLAGGPPRASEGFESGARLRCWRLCLQVMRAEEADNLTFNPFDPAAAWPLRDFPIIDVGLLEFEVPACEVL